jgi:hypothetical protein
MAQQIGHRFEAGPVLNQRSGKGVAQDAGSLDRTTYRGLRHGRTNYPGNLNGS